MSEDQLKKAHFYLENRRFEEAQAIFEGFIAEESHLGEALNGLGLCTEARGELTQAEDYYRQALQHKPHEPEFHNNLAICLQQQERLEEAREAFLSLLALQPDPYSTYNLALIEVQLENYLAALNLLQNTLKLAPGWEMPQAQLPLVIHRFSQQPDSFAHLRQALAQHPDSGFWNLAMGIYFELKQSGDASLRYYRAALRCDPSLSEVYRLLINQLQYQSEFARSLDIALRLHELEKSPHSLFHIMMGLQEPIPASREMITKLRHDIKELVSLYLDDPAPTANNARNRPQALNFYHFYQGQADRPMQELLQRFYASYLEPLPQRVRSVHAKPRLAIVSLHLHQHSVMHLLERALHTLIGSGEFETWAFFLPNPPFNREDEVLEGFKTGCDHFVYLSKDYRENLEQISASEPDLLVYPDIGMEPFTYTLAQHRLAPCQMVLPGHPVTTGMPQMDYFISGAGLEPPDGELDFTETLIRLPGLPDYARPVIPPPASRAALRLPEGPLYFCPMTLFKVHPDFDAVLQLILDRHPEAQIAFLENKNNIHLRLGRRFDQSILRGRERIHFVPWGPQAVFFQRMCSADVILDTFYFGGGNTSYQALGLGCPIVTLDCRWNKGRWTQALYHQMDLKGLVAASPEEYAELAIQLASDSALNTSWREKIRLRNAVLFDNPTWSEALLAFCLEQAQRIQPTYQI